MRKITKKSQNGKRYGFVEVKFREASHLEDLGSI